MTKLITINTNFELLKRLPFFFYQIQLLRNPSVVSVDSVFFIATLRRRRHRLPTLTTDKLETRAKRKRVLRS